ncbi:hypothetical protein H4R19_001805, partial [Coemansia spiralis]
MRSRGDGPGVAIALPGGLPGAVRGPAYSDAEEPPPLEVASGWALKNSIAGAGAGCVSSVATCPLDVVKTRLQYQGVLERRYAASGYRPYTGTVNALRRIVAEEGVRGLYRGLTPMMMGYLPTWGIYFTVYEALKRRLPGPAAAAQVAAAMGAGASTSLLTNPIWVLKSRFMTQSAFTEYQYTGIWH